MTIKIRQLIDQNKQSGGPDFKMYQVAWMNPNTVAWLVKANQSLSGS